MKKSECLRFNINHYFHVKLNEEGYYVWKKEAEQWIFEIEKENLKRTEMESLSDYKNRVQAHKDYVKHLKDIGVHPLSWYKDKADKNGYVAFQAWNFIDIFGKYSPLDAGTLYQTNLLIKKSDLTPVK